MTTPPPAPGPQDRPGPAPQPGHPYGRPTDQQAPPAPPYGAVPPYGPGPTPPPRGTGGDSFFTALRGFGLVRTQERWIGGVAGGLALRLGIDPLVTRGLLAASVLLGGFGLVLYGLAWALLPEQRDGRIHLQELFRGRFTAGFLGSVVVLLMGLSSLPERWLPGWWGPDSGAGGWWFGFLWLSAAAVVVALLVQNRQQPNGPAPRPPAGPAGGWPPPPPGTPSAPDQEGPAMSEDTSPTQAYPTQPYPTQGYPTQGYPPVRPAARATGPTTSLPVVPPSGPVPGYGPGYAQGYGQGWAGAAGAVPPPPPAPPVPPRPRPQGPGAATVGVVVSLTLLTLAGLLLAERAGTFEGPVLLTAGAVGVVLAGLAVVVSGLRGRTAGALGWLAVLGILVLLPFAGAEREGWGWYRTSVVVGEVAQTPLTDEQAEAGYSVAAGQVRVDLTELDLEGRRGAIEVPISVGAGDVVVTVPQDAAVDAEITLHAGRLQWFDTFAGQVSTGVPEEYESPAVEEGAEPQMHLDITVGAGNVTVVEE